MDKHLSLHPRIPMPTNDKTKNVLVYLSSIGGGSLSAVGINLDTNKADYAYTNGTITNPDEIFRILSGPKLKAVIFQWFNFKSSQYPNNLSFYQKVAEKLENSKIPYTFMNPYIFGTTLSLIASKIIAKPKEIVIIVDIYPNQLETVQIIRENDGYVFSLLKFINYDANNLYPLQIRTAILHDKLQTILLNPAYIVVTIFHPSCMPLAIRLKSDILKDKNVIISEKPTFDEGYPYLLKHLADPSYTDYYIFRRSSNLLAVTNDLKMNDSSLKRIIVNIDDRLPLEKSCIVPKSLNPYYVMLHDQITKECDLGKKSETTILMDKNYHRIKLILIVDENNLPYLYQEPYLIPAIEDLPKKLLTSNPNLEMPIIGFFDNSSVICIPEKNNDGGNGYKFLDSWNGKYGHDLFLNFHEEKPKLITNIKDVDAKDNSIVYDLIKILSISPAKIKIDPEWKFKITKDDEHPILIEFKNFDGKLKASSPTFLMALILKHHFKAIKNENGNKPNELGFCLNCCEWNKEEKKNIQDGLKESCKLLKIESTHFLNGF